LITCRSQENAYTEIIIKAGSQRLYK
jgi:hypothetical protein